MEQPRVPRSPENGDDGRAILQDDPDEAVPAPITLLRIHEFQEWEALRRNPIAGRAGSA
jgi:hypothetical protein